MYLILGGSSLIKIQIGQISDFLFEHLKIDTPSVFMVTEMLAGNVNNPPGVKNTLYCSPP